MKQIKGFHPTKVLQRAYEAGIKAITGRVLLAKQKEQTFGEWIASLAARSQQKDIQDASHLLASRMVISINVGNQKTWREAAARSSQSQKLFRLLEREMQGATGARVQSLIRENAKLISSVPVETATKLSEEIAKAQQSGARASTIAKMYQRRFPELIKSRVNLISRTETAKASTALTQARCERLNLDWIIWETSRDVRTRESHKNMQGVVFSWSDLPSPEALVGETSVGKYGPGEVFNCRCTPIVVLTLDDIKFPARVYWQGSIKTMDKQAFKKIAIGLEEMDAA